MLSWKDAFRMALPPALIALAVTLLRLAGELQGWSEAWFSRATSGLVPEGAVSWLVGITWLALPFGAWFAFRLARSGAAIPPAGRAVLLATLALVVLYGGTRLVSLLRLGFPGFLLAIWTMGVLAAVLAWQLLRSGERPPSTGRAVLVQELPFWTAYLALAFIPQLVFWVAFTIVVGMLAGTLVVTLGARRGEERG